MWRSVTATEGQVAHLASRLPLAVIVSQQVGSNASPIPVPVAFCDDDASVPRRGCCASVSSSGAVVRAHAGPDRAPARRSVRSRSGRCRRGSMTATTAPPITDAVRVLLVDDDATNLSVLHQTLTGRGYQLLAARTGEDAIKIARRTHPALILLDIMMPGIDGYETCWQLRDDAQTRD